MPKILPDPEHNVVYHLRSAKTKSNRFVGIMVCWDEIMTVTVYYPVEIKTVFEI